MSGYVWNGKRAVNPCACGCGEEAPIARRTDRRNGQIKGRPLRYICGHNPRGQKSTVPSAAQQGAIPPSMRPVPSLPLRIVRRPAPKLRKVCPDCRFLLRSDTHRIVCVQAGHAAGAE